MNHKNILDRMEEVLAAHDPRNFREPPRTREEIEQDEIRIRELVIKYLTGIPDRSLTCGEEWHEFFDDVEQTYRQERGLMSKEIESPFVPWIARMPIEQRDKFMHDLELHIKLQDGKITAEELYQARRK